MVSSSYYDWYPCFVELYYITYTWTCVRAHTQKRVIPYRVCVLCLCKCIYTHCRYSCLKQIVNQIYFKKGKL